MKGDPFKYADDDWRKMEAIVERAGGAVAREKFNAQRAGFEKMAGGWKGRISAWNGKNFGRDETHLYKHVEEAARELKGALTNLNFPAIFIGNELVWERLSDTCENEQRYARFLQAIEHVEARAAMRAAPRRKQARLVRDRFIGDLWRAWTGLGLKPASSKASLMVQFIEAACDGMCDRRDKPTSAMISNTIRNWPRQ